MANNAKRVYKRIKLNEVSRRDLINRSKNVEATKLYGTTRYERRMKCKVIDTVASFNKVDMNALFKGNMLSFIVPVQGETNKYNVELLFEGILDEIQKEIKRNNNKCEYKVIYRALLNALNKEDILVSCNCYDYLTTFAVYATRGGFNSGKPETRPANIKNPRNSKGTACKHILKVLDNLDWAMKLASTINNYIIYMEKNYNKKYRDFIFPAIYGMKYDKAVQLGLFDDEEDDNLANSMDKAEDSKILDTANKVKPTDNTGEQEVKTEEGQ